MKKNTKRNNVKFSKLVITVALFCFIAIIGRVIQLSVSKEIDGVNLKQLASKRTTKTDVLPARRGTIYSTNKDVLAQNISSYKLIAYLDEKRTEDKKNPQHVVNKEETAKALAPILGYTEEEVLSYLNKENAYQTEFGTKGKGLNDLVKSKIEELNLPGLDFVESYKRYYPKGDFLAYTLGYTKITTDIVDKVEKETLTGEMGIESYYDKILKGEDGHITYQKDMKGYKIAETPVIKKDAVEGKDIYLTVDSNVQFFIEQAIKNAKENFGFEWFTIVVADAKTGKIIGLSSSPSFDPNLRNMTNYLDLTISSPYEPGSTQKTFTYMAAMENNVYNPNESFKSGTYVTADNTEIGDWNRAGWGEISYDRGYALSSNVGIINLISRHMSSAMLRQYDKKLGFGQKTGISLPNEATGSLNFKYETEVYNAGFGQGITTTPMQNIQALTPLTNDGILIKPYLVEKIVNPTTNEVIFKGKRKEIERVASTETANKMIQLMDDTVNGLGNTGSGYRIESGQLIGKTGTAQIANEKGGGYLSGKEDIISSFAGIYPKDDPEVIIYASVKRPSDGSQKGISTAVKQLVEDLSKYYGHEPTEEKGEKVVEYKLPSFINKKLDTVKATLTTNNMNNQIILGTGTKVIKQFPNAKTKVTSKDRVFLITNDNNLTIPNVVGYSGKEAEALMKLLNIKVKLEGSGYVMAQSIAETTPITPGMEITLVLNPKFDANQ